MLGCPVRRSLYLSDFRPLPARFSLAQARAAQTLVELRLLLRARAAARGADLPPLERPTLARWLLRFGAGASAIATRGTDLEDYALDLPAELDRLTLFDADEPPDTTRRMDLFRALTRARLAELYPDDATTPDHLIHVTCTGYVAPSAAQALAARRGGIQVTHAYHMGCYASLPAIRIGRGLAEDGRVDIVHTELCTLHFDPAALDPAQLIVQSLFADGHIRYTLDAAPPARGLEVCALRERLLPDTDDRMTWIVGARQFAMTLARDVPAMIRPHLRGFVDDLLHAAGARDPAIFAVHPGGPRIIDQVEQALDLDPSQTRESRAVLRRHGNMSSATLPHIWAEILADPGRRAGDLVVSLAFGPGLTLSGGVFRVCRP